MTFFIAKSAITPVMFEGYGKKMLVGERGFEPPASSSRTKRATKLRHSPYIARGLAEAA